MINSLLLFARQHSVKMLSRFLLASIRPDQVVSPGRLAETSVIAGEGVPLQSGQLLGADPLLERFKQIGCQNVLVAERHQQ